MIKLPFKGGGGGDPCPNKTFAEVGNRFSNCLQCAGGPSKVNRARERCPGASNSLPAACHLALSYFWDIVPSLGKQTLSPLLSPIKKRKKITPPQNKTIQNSFLHPQSCFQNGYPNVVLDAKCLGGGVHLPGAKVEISIALKARFTCGQGNLVPLLGTRDLDE